MSRNSQNFARRLVILALMAATGALCSVKGQDRGGAPEKAMALSDRTIHSSLCLIGYQVDKGVPGMRGYRYLFFGNGFFINRDGYIVTAAHVLSQLHGSQPQILLRGPGVPGHFVQANVISVDSDHDVAILQATPNPFDGNDPVSFLPLGHDLPGPGRPVLAASLHPIRPLDAYSRDIVVDDRSAGDVLRFEFSKLEKGRPVDTELFLFNHAINPGQSGGPVISRDAQSVAGIVEGQWLRDESSEFEVAKSTNSPAPAEEAVAVPGAVIPIHYAIDLLQQKNISWQAGPGEATVTGELDSETASAATKPYSLVTASYPSDSLFGGEVVLDATVNGDGTLSDVRSIHGDQPFVEKAVDTVQSWTLLPAKSGGHVSPSRVPIVFQFPEPYFPPRATTTHQYQQNQTGTAPDAVATPLKTVEPQIHSVNMPEGSVILYESISNAGEVTSVQTVSGVEPLASAAVAAAKEWRFAPARQSGAAVESVAIVVFVFRQPLSTPRAPQ